MKVLAIIIGIIVFFALVLSIRVKVSLDYAEKPACSVRWLFIKIPVYPPKEKTKKPKKEKAKKDNKKKEKAEEPPAEKAPAEKKENPFMVFFKKEGVEGVYSLLSKTVSALNSMIGKIIRQFRIEELYLYMLIGAGDAAETAQKYGETCAKFFPLLGAIVSNFKVKKYDIDISPDFLANKDKAEFHTVISLSPRKLINSVLVFGLKLLFGVLLKFLLKSRPKKNKAAKQNTKTPPAPAKETSEAAAV